MCKIPRKSCDLYVELYIGVVFSLEFFFSSLIIFQRYFPECGNCSSDHKKKMTETENDRINHDKPIKILICVYKRELIEKIRMRIITRKWYGHILNSQKNVWQLGNSWYAAEVTIKYFCMRYREKLGFVFVIQNLTIYLLYELYAVWLWVVLKKTYIVYSMSYILIQKRSIA